MYNVWSLWTLNNSLDLTYRVGHDLIRDHANSKSTVPEQTRIRPKYMWVWLSLDLHNSLAMYYSDYVQNSCLKAVEQNLWTTLDDECSAILRVQRYPDSLLSWMFHDGLQVMCFYFVFTVFSTVGFGDIFAVNTTERVRIKFSFSANSILYTAAVNDKLGRPR